MGRAPCFNAQAPDVHCALKFGILPYASLKDSCQCSGCFWGPLVTHYVRLFAFTRIVEHAVSVIWEMVSLNIEALNQLMSRLLSPCYMRHISTQIHAVRSITGLLVISVICRLSWFDVVPIVTFTSINQKVLVLNENLVIVFRLE